MKFRFDTATKIVLLVLVVIGILLALLVPWQCAKSQTAGSFNMTFYYTPGVDRAMKRQYGEDWINTFIKPQLREAWKNHKSTTQEAYKLGLSELFSEDIHPDDLLKTEANKLQQIADSAAARKARRLQREADSLAALQSQGALIEEEEEPPQYTANVGKAYSPRMLFTQTLPATEGGGGGQPPPLAHGYITAPQLAVVVAVLVVGAVAVVAAGYGLYHAGKWLLKR